MSKYRITFSEEYLTVSGKPLDEEKKKNGERALMGATEAQLENIGSARIMELGAENVVSKCENEKGALQICLAEARKGVKLGKNNKILDLAESIENSDGFVEMDGEDLEYVREGFDKLKEQPPWWRYLGKLFKQVEAPEEIKEDA
jgi:hypothetical protein